MLERLSDCRVRGLRGISFCRQFLVDIITEHGIYELMLAEYPWHCNTRAILDARLEWWYLRLMAYMFDRALSAAGCIKSTSVVAWTTDSNMDFIWLGKRGECEEVV